MLGDISGEGEGKPVKKDVFVRRKGEFDDGVERGEKNSPR